MQDLVSKRGLLPELFDGGGQVYSKMSLPSAEGINRNRRNWVGRVPGRMRQKSFHRQIDVQKINELTKAWRPFASLLLITFFLSFASILRYLLKNLIA